MPNIQDVNFNKNVSMVYVEEAGFTGYRGFDFSKIDNVEDILKQGVVVSGFDQGSVTTNAILSGVRSSTQSIDGKLFITGDQYPAGVQGTIVYQGDLSQQFDGVTTFQEQSSLINNYTVSGSNGLVLTSNPYRRELYIQNLSTGTLYIKYGLDAHNSSFNFLLASNSSTDAGDGGSLNDQGYNGNVSVSGVAGVNSPRYICWERSSPKEPLV